MKETHRLDMCQPLNRKAVNRIEDELRKLAEEVPAEEWDALDKRRYAGKRWAIGDKVRDEDGNEGIVLIKWNDGDRCTWENDAAHPNPVLVEEE